MIEWPSVNFFLIQFTTLLDERCGLSRDIAFGQGSEQLDGEAKRVLALILGHTADACRSLGLSECRQVANDLRSRLQRGVECNKERARAELAILTNLMYQRFASEPFLYVPGNLRELFEQDNLFGLSRPNEFPSVREDIRTAGTCIALGLDTAAVYHLMRVAEIGLRALARHLRVRLRDKHGKLPVDWAQWEPILDRIESEIQRRYPQAGVSKPTKAREREFYNGLWVDLTGFKDMYRNNVMHVRKSYTSHEAMGALHYVREFMRRLSSRIDEHGRTKRTTRRKPTKGRSPASSRSSLSP